MNSASLQKQQRWLGPRFIGLVAMVFCGQLAIVLWLGQRQIKTPRIADPVSSLQLAGEASTELLKLEDPTLFALPHREGFSGAAWLSIPSQEIRPFAWTEPLRFRDLQVQELAALPAALVTRAEERWPATAYSAPDLSLPVLEPVRLFITKSTLRLTGPLESRRVAMQLELPSWPSSDVLSNSVVQMQVDAAGLPFSALLLERSGYKEADDYALRQARSMRFKALDAASGASPPPSNLTGGELVFEWHTMPTSNSVVSKP
jgi:hypothetical protein